LHPDLPAVAPSSIEIEEMLLRVPGVDRADVPAIVDEVLRRVSQRLRGTHRVGRVHQASVTVPVAAGASRGELIEALAARIEEVLR
jgi:hypothetical protein